MEPYVLHPGGGRAYLWHGVRVEVKAGSAELNGRMALTETVTRKGEEPHTHIHAEEDELFYVLDGKLTFHCNESSFDVEERAFVFVPKGTPHAYTIRSDGEVRFLVVSVPGSFGEHIELTGERTDGA